MQLLKMVNVGTGNGWQQRAVGAWGYAIAEVVNVGAGDGEQQRAVGGVGRCGHGSPRRLHGNATGKGWHGISDAHSRTFSPTRCPCHISQRYAALATKKLCA